MPLLPSQYAALKADIDANQTVILVGGVPTEIRNVPNTPDTNADVRDWYNGLATPAYFGFRTSVPVNEIMANGFVWTRVDNATVGKARIWDWMTRIGTIDPSKPNIVAGINEAWSGAANDAHRAAIFVHCQRPATRAEQLLKAFGNGTTITDQGTGPAVLGFAGQLTTDEVTLARTQG